MDVKVAAELAEMPVKEFRELNPQFNKPVITGGDETKILLPTSRVKRFQENLSKWGKALTEWTSHSVTSAKERVASIAKRFGTTPDVIRAANNIPGKMEVAVGSTLLVPKLEASADSGSYKRISEDAKIELRTPPKDPPHHVSRYRHSGKSGQDGVGHKRHRRHHSEE
jgi:membrane-bound lytic murein transglycosylase D